MPVLLGEDQVQRLMAGVQENGEYCVTIDPEKSLVTDEQGFSAAFKIGPFQRYCLLNGLDDISLTLRHEAEIAAYEAARARAARSQ